MTATLEGGQCSAARPVRTLPPGKTRYPFYRRLGVPQGRSRRAENLVPTWIRSPDRQARSQSLYRLSCRAHQYNVRSDAMHIYQTCVGGSKFTEMILFNEIFRRVPEALAKNDYYLHHVCPSILPSVCTEQRDSQMNFL